MAQSDFLALNQSAIKEIKRNASLRYRAGALDFSKALSMAEYNGKQCVLYLKDKVEYRTAWFYSKQRAEKALEIIKAKFGQAIIYID